MSIRDYGVILFAVLRSERLPIKSPRERTAAHGKGKI